MVQWGHQTLTWYGWNQTGVDGYLMRRNGYKAGIEVVHCKHRLVELQNGKQGRSNGDEEELSEESVQSERQLHLAGTKGSFKELR